MLRQFVPREACFLVAGDGSFTRSAGSSEAGSDLRILLRPVPVLPPVDALRLQEHLHGHLGWLAAIALVHPALLLRSASRKAHLSVALASALVTAVGGWGIVIYPAYREKLRQPIFAHAAFYGYLFERKEHLAFGAILLAWTGAVTYIASFLSKGAVVAPLRRAAHVAFISSAGLALATAAIGTLVAAYRTF